MEEILSLSDNPKNPSMTVFLKPNDGVSRVNSQRILNMIEETKLRNVVDNMTICFEPNSYETSMHEDACLLNTYKEFEDMLDEVTGEDPGLTEKSKWVVRFEMNKYILIEKNITLDDIDFCLKSVYGNSISTIYSDYNADSLVFRIRVQQMKQTNKEKTKSLLDQSDEISHVKNFADQVMDNISLRGVKNISKMVLRKEPTLVEYKESKYDNKTVWVLDSVGSNLLSTLALDYIDTCNTYTNSITEMQRVLGIEAARQSIYVEFLEITEKDGAYINSHHLSLLTDRMTYSYKMISIFRHGINNDDVGPMAKASFEETPEMFLKAAKHAEFDDMMGISSNVMCGQLGNYGTNMFDVIVDYTSFHNEPARPDATNDRDVRDLIDTLTTNADVGQCSTSNLQLHQHAQFIDKMQINSDMINTDYDIDI